MPSPIRRLCALLACAVGVAVLRAEPQALHVSGNQLLGSDGHPARLRGVNCAGMEFSSNGEGRIMKTVTVAVTGWHANLIRLPLSQDRWFGKAPDQTDGGAAYRELVHDLVEFCSAHGVHILLDLHWSDAGEWGRNIGQHNLPDANSVAFWKNLAPVYKDDPAVLFDLYNEPTRITWEQWLKGGPMAETDEKTGVTLGYQAVGMQAVLDAIRSTGAHNVVVAGGINWAYDLGGVLAGSELSDAGGDGVVYGAHPYPHSFKGFGRETPSQWEARMVLFGRKLPFIVSEFGSSTADWPFPDDWDYDNQKWNREMLGILRNHGWNWTAWDFHPSARPCLISDWNYTPTEDFGVWVKQALAENAN
jgi:hypothetical protein